MIRQPAVAGRFYPNSAEALNAFLDRALIGEPLRSATAIIAPHAGYVYSGETAGRGFAEIAGKFSRIVLLGPSHYEPFYGISIAPFDSYRTPLGELAVDREACDALLASCSLACELRKAHDREHALEVELPFIQRRWPDACIVPIVCGQMTWSEAEGLARDLKGLWADPGTLFVISSDFTHFGQAFDYAPDVAPETLDRGAIDAIVARRGFTDYIDRTGTTVCGARPIATLLALLTAESTRLVHYTNSAEISGDRTQVVGYASILFEERLSQADQKTLLELARRAIRQADTLPPNEASDVLRNHGSCFVTLHLNGQLRGCIGSIAPYQALAENVIRNARAAAYEDSRFSPVIPELIPDLEIEISYLTPSEPIADIADFVLGRHGIVLEQGRNRSVFLPQVPGEQGWDKTTTLEYLSRKAGLSSDAWRAPGCSFSVFESLCFSE
jgi:MEMO1 family protein